jgi:hypothetical protein
MAGHRSTEHKPQTDRTGGGPGSSHQGGGHGHTTRDRDDHGPEPGEATNTRASRISGGGGERDSHHTHHNPEKGGKTPGD